MLHSDYRFTCELSLEYSLTPSPLMGADGFPRMEAIPRCRTYARQMFDRFLLGGSDPFMYRMQDLWLDLYQAPWAIPQDKEQLLNDLSAKVASGELFIYLETDQLALGPGRYERSGPGAPPEPPEDAPRTSSTSETHSASMGAAPAAGLPVADSDGVNAGSAVEGEGVVPVNTNLPAVKAKGSVGGATFDDVNQTARLNADANKKTLIHDNVSLKEAKTGKQLPNGDMSTAHAEVGVIQQAYDAGKTQGASMNLLVEGKAVCGYCRGDVAKMAEKAGLESLTVEEAATGKTLYWERGMRSLKEAP